VKVFRPYQADASKAIVSTWQKHKSCMCVVATGGGKTLIAAGTAAKIQNNGRILFLANRNELCTQPLSVFAEQCGIAPALEKADSFAPLEARVVVGSVQTITRKKRLERFPSDHFAYIFADEAHMAAAESWKRIFTHFSSARICGITATPFRTDNKNLTEIFEAEAYRMPLFDLVDQGYLVSPDHVDKLSTAISLAQVRVRRTAEGKDYDLQDAHDAIMPYLREIAKELKARHSNRHILAFLPLVASSQKFVEACVAEGLNAVHIDGEDPERDQKLEAFKEGRITILANSNLLHTGVDMPVCDATLNLRPTRSKVLYQQIVGRSTRTVPGLIDAIEDIDGRLRAIARSTKPEAFIIDPLWLSAEHDLVTPSYLVAQNEEEALEMNKRAGKSYSLRGLNRQVQLEREEVIRRRLERVANFREHKVPASYFAACTGEHALVNYQPVFKWEAEPPVRFSCLLLAKAGIDPESVTSEGQAREVLQAIGRRRYHGLAEIPQLASIVETQGIAPWIWYITKRQLLSGER
jgi:superfamily II DNA or RNA helicase